jgi:integrase
MPVYYDDRAKRYFLKVCYKGKRYCLYKNPVDGALFKNKHEALTAEPAFLASLGDRSDKAADGVPCETMFAGFLATLPATLKPSSVYLRVKLFNKYLGPLFKGLDAQKLTNEDLERLNSDLNAKDHYSNIKTTAAVAKRFIVYLQRVNPGLNPSHFFGFKSYCPDQHIYHIWSREEEVRFLSVIDNPRDKLIFTLLVDYGLRISECLALQYSDFDFEMDTISIRRIMTCKTMAKHQIFTSPKTKNSIRTLKLLSEVKDLMGTERRSGFLFPGVKSQVVGEMVIRRANSDYAKKAGMAPLRLHEFRHSCASNLLKAGIPVRVVARWLGDTEATVMAFYSHLFPDEKEIIGDWLNGHPLLHV